MGGLVGVDVGVFDDGLAGRLPCLEPELPLGDAAGQGDCQRLPVEVEVQVPAPGDLHPPDAGEPAGIRGEFPGDPGGRLPHLAGQVEGDGKRQFPELDPGGDGETQGVVTDPVFFENALQQRVLEVSGDGQQHGSLSVLVGVAVVRCSP